MLGIVRESKPKRACAHYHNGTKKAIEKRKSALPTAQVHPWYQDSYRKTAAGTADRIQYEYICIFSGARFIATVKTAKTLLTSGLS